MVGAVLSLTVGLQPEKEMTFGSLSSAGRCLSRWGMDCLHACVPEAPPRARPSRGTQGMLMESNRWMGRRVEGSINEGKTLGFGSCALGANVRVQARPGPDLVSAAHKPRDIGQIT